MVPVVVRSRPSVLLAMPKSPTLAVPSAARSTLPGLTSRWSTPAAWDAARAAATSAPMRRARSGASGPSANLSAKVRPGRSSMTRKGTPSCSPLSKTATTLGWLSPAAARASASKRSRTPGSDARWGLSRFTATSRSSRRSRAAHTSPMPPRPMSPRSW